MLAIIGLIPTIGLGLALWQMTNANSVLANRIAGTKPHTPTASHMRQSIPDKWREAEYQRRQKEAEK